MLMLIILRLVYHTHKYMYSQFGSKLNFNVQKATLFYTCSCVVASYIHNVLFLCNVAR